MSETNPIKRHPSLVSFSRDHHFGLLLSWKIRQGVEKEVSSERIINYVIYFFDNDLGKLFKEEEKLLFEKLSSDDLFRKKAEEQHDAIRQSIATIRDRKDQRVALLQLADKLELYIRFAERELFNHLQEKIPAEELEKLSKRVPNESRKIDDKWKDVFWSLEDAKGA